MQPDNLKSQPILTLFLGWHETWKIIESIWTRVGFDYKTILSLITLNEHLGVVVKTSIRYDKLASRLLNSKIKRSCVFFYKYQLKKAYFVKFYVEFSWQGKARHEI